MTHSDDEGLVIPPRLAPTQVVIVPIPKPNEAIMEVAEKLEKQLKGAGIRVKIDRDKKKRPGFKFAQYEMEGVPVRVGIGMRDLKKNQVEVARRDTKEKTSVALEGLDRYIGDLLENIQNGLFQKAVDYRTAHTSETTDIEEFKDILENKGCLLYTSPSPRDATLSRMPSSA